MYTDPNWEEKFKRIGAFWRHSGDPCRPYALLTNSLITDSFFNADRVFSNPQVTEQAIGHLIHHPTYRHILEATLMKQAPQPVRGTTMSDPIPSYQENGPLRPTRIIGIAYGGIIPAYSAAHHAGAACGYATKRPDDTLSLGRCEIAERDSIVIIEDTISTGGTVRKLRVAIEQGYPNTRIVKCVLTLCNRSGSTNFDDFEIVALFSPLYRTWKRGKNPFTKDGQEHVEPVHPKPHWDEFVN